MELSLDIEFGKINILGLVQCTSTPIPCKRIHDRVPLTYKNVYFRVKVLAKFRGRKSKYMCIFLYLALTIALCILCSLILTIADEIEVLFKQIITISQRCQCQVASRAGTDEMAIKTWARTSV